MHVAGWIVKCGEGALGHGSRTTRGEASACNPNDGDMALRPNERQQAHSSRPLIVGSWSSMHTSVQCLQSTGRGSVEQCGSRPSQHIQCTQATRTPGNTLGSPVNALFSLQWCTVKISKTCGCHSPSAAWRARTCCMVSAVRVEVVYRKPCCILAPNKQYVGGLPEEPEPEPEDASVAAGSSWIPLLPGLVRDHRLQQSAVAGQIPARRHEPTIPEPPLFHVLRW